MESYIKMRPHAPTPRDHRIGPLLTSKGGENDSAKCQKFRKTGKDDEGY